jgi:uncharacterized coiled-coil DUF342 family protein
MLNENENKELIQKFNQDKIEITKLRNQLNDLNNQKESWFDKFEQIRRDISRIIREKRESFSKRNSATVEVKSDKVKREEFNKQIKEKIEEKKKILLEKDHIEAKFGMKIRPSEIKEKINKIEYKIETEVMGIEKEKKLMKEIKDLKKKFEEYKKVSDVWDKIKIVDKEIDALRLQSNEVHQRIQSKAQVSQESHVAGISKDTQLKELEAKQAEALVKCDEFKMRFTEVKKELEAKLAEMGKLGFKVSDVRHEQQAERNKQDDMRKEKETMHIKDLEEQVHQKLKKGQKLTNEDLLIFQARSR